MTPGPADFGLHRGRRTFAAILVAGLLVWAGHALWPVAPPDMPPPAPPEVAIAAQPGAPPAPPPRAAAPKRRAKAARTGAPGPTRAPARAEPAAVALPPPPPMPAPEPPEPAPEVAVEAPPAADPEPAPEPAWDGNGESIARAIAAEKRAAVRLCFERELKQQPTLTGNVTVELDLAPPDRVNEVRVSDDLQRPAFTQCVASAMHEARFAALNEEVSVRVPYVLSPASVR